MNCFYFIYDYNRKHVHLHDAQTPECEYEQGHGDIGQKRREHDDAAGQIMIPLHDDGHDVGDRGRRHSEDDIDHKDLLRSEAEVQGKHYRCQRQ